MIFGRLHGSQRGWVGRLTGLGGLREMFVDFGKHLKLEFPLSHAWSWFAARRFGNLRVSKHR